MGITAAQAKEKVEQLQSWFEEHGTLGVYGVRANGDVIDPDGDDISAGDAVVEGIDEIIRTAEQVTEFLVELRRLKRFFAWAKTMPEWEADVGE